MYIMKLIFHKYPYFDCAVKTYARVKILLNNIVPAHENALFREYFSA